jgi:hypothetical protein
MQRISFVGSSVTPKGVEIEPNRVRTIAEWPEPANHHNIQVFFSFANFHERFISSFLCMAKPMIDMLKGGKNSPLSGHFLPTLMMIRSFAELRNVFTKAPVLTHFDPAGPIYLETDASGFAIAGIISQQ